TIVDDLRSSALGFLRGASKGDEASWQELVMEACLAILPIPSLPIKNTIFTAFGVLASKMDEGALQLLLNVFNPVETKAEVHNEMEEETGNDTGSESEDSSSSEEEDDEASLDEKNIDQLRHDLRAALEFNSGS